MADAFKNEITQLALHHQLLSKHTSFVAVEEQISRSFNEFLAKVVIPNAMPQGNTMAVPVPQGGLGVRQLWLVTITCFLLLALIKIFLYSRTKFTSLKL